jgi:hypothetical protein
LRHELKQRPLHADGRFGFECSSIRWKNLAGQYDFTPWGVADWHMA